MNGWTEEPILFQCGHERLVGVVHQAVGSRRSTGVLIVVGGPQYRVGSHRQFTLTARSLASCGFPVMRFDCRGMGDSDGRFQGFEETGSDIAAAIKAFLGIVPAMDRVVLWGLCDAASAILMHGHENPRVGGLILANPWVQTESSEADSFLRHYYWRRIVQRSFWIKLLKIRVNLRSSLGDWLGKIRAARSADAPARFVERMLSGMNAFAGPVLILLSEHDLVARQFGDQCRATDEWRQAVGRGNVTVHHLASADHTFSGRAALDAAMSASLQWLSQSDTRPCR